MSTQNTRGVQPDQVWAAADAVLIEQGKRPTIERVRQHLGRGSPNTVAPLLDEWFAKLGTRLKSPEEETAISASANSTKDAAAASTVPTCVQETALKLWELASSEAETQAQRQAEEDWSAKNQALLEAQEELEKAEQVLRSEQLELQIQQRALAQSLFLADEQQQRLTQRLAQMQQLLMDTQSSAQSAALAHSAECAALRGQEEAAKKMAQTLNDQLHQSRQELSEQASHHQYQQMCWKEQQQAMHQELQELQQQIQQIQQNEQKKNRQRPIRAGGLGIYVKNLKPKTRRLRHTL